MRRASASYAERFEKEKYYFTRTTHQKWPGTAQKTGIEADVINAINSISPSSSWGLLRPSSWLRRGFFYLRKSSGSLAMFAAMRRALTVWR
jgi:hypothetical protein